MLTKQLPYIPKTIVGKYARAKQLIPDEVIESLPWSLKVRARKYNIRLLGLKLQALCKVINKKHRF